jgi:TolB-like protein/class 3 adenylate cyclase/tetratricopeptide (TPR) repeat protein
LPAGRVFLEYNRLLAQVQERRLAAIFVADAVSYSSLMGMDEEGTHGKYKSDLANVIEPLIRRSRGRIIKKTGDGVLAIFPSVVDAVDCGSRMQGYLPADSKNPASPRTELQYRVGINVGDIIIEDDDVYGNDVNVAVRIEALSPPGGLALSGLAYWNVKGRTPLKFEELGFLRLKNIAEPIQVYRAATADTPGDQPMRAALPSSPADNVDEASPQRTWSEDRSHQPEIVVLPFENLSSDPEQEYFCDGLTNDLTTDLSRFANLFVIAANTAFSYKGRHPSHERVRRELAVDYMVEGSVQRTGNQIRVNAQLVETRTGRHLWAERYKSAIEKLFDVQDDVCRKIVMALVVKLSHAELTRASHRDTDKISAYEAFLKGLHCTNEFLSSSETQTKLEAARRWFERAVELDPLYARPYGWLAYLKVLEWKHGWSDDSELPVAEEMARKAVALNPSDHDTHWALASVCSNTGKFDRALQAYEKALEINGNEADLHAEMADLTCFSGKHREAIGQIRFAMHANPHFPEWYRCILGWCYYFIGEYREAIAEVERVITPTEEAMLILAACHARLAEAGASNGHAEAARRYMRSFIDRRPGWTIARQQGVTRLRRPEDMSNLIEGLRLAGLEQGG